MKFAAAISMRIFTAFMSHKTATDAGENPPPAPIPQTTTNTPAAIAAESEQSEMKNFIIESLKAAIFGAIMGAFLAYLAI